MQVSEEMLNAACIAYDKTTGEGFDAKLRAAIEAALSAEGFAVVPNDRERIAALVDPGAFVCTPEMYGLRTQKQLEARTWIGPLRNAARKQADAILALADDRAAQHGGDDAT